jgi:hypothetical protein
MISQKDNEEGKLFVGGKYPYLIQFFLTLFSFALWRALNTRNEQGNSEKFYQKIL